VLYITAQFSIIVFILLQLPHDCRLPHSCRSHYSMLQLLLGCECNFVRG
jgi:hypothetical protein